MYSLRVTGVTRAICPGCGFKVFVEQAQRYCPYRSEVLATKETRAPEPFRESRDMAAGQRAG